MNEILGSRDDDDDDASRRNKWLRMIANLFGGSIPIVGGAVSAAAGFWSEADQERAMDALRAWVKMLEDELREKQRTVLEIVSRLDMHDEEISNRVKSEEYQQLLKKAFRNWSGTESRKKQEYVRNILLNAAVTKIVSDDVVSLFIEWLQRYSEFHFAVIGEIYRQPGFTRGEIWEQLGKGVARENSAEADLFKLLIRDLSTGGIIRQHRDTDYAGNFIPRQKAQQRNQRAGKALKSAFDDAEEYELTALGSQFVHYAMSELSTKITHEDGATKAPA